MMPFRFPLRWGIPGTAAVPTAPIVPLWTAIGPEAQNWVSEGGLIQPRFARIMVAEDTGPQFVKVTDVVR